MCSYSDLSCLMSCTSWVSMSLWAIFATGMLIGLTLLGVYLWIAGSDWYNIGSWRRWWRQMFSEFLIGDGVSRECRTQFNASDVGWFAGRKNHTHGFSAAARFAASKHCIAVAQSLGRTAYFVQMAKRDVDAGCVGSRSYFDPKDVETIPSSWDPPANPLFVLVDVDYYMNMPVELATTFAGHPLILYTMVPPAAARGTGEVCWTFGPDGTLATSVSGGASYSHQLWDYGADVLIARTGARYATFAVDRKNVLDYHQLVMLSPVASYTFPLSVIAGAMLPGRVIRRFDPVVGDDNKFVRMHLQTQDGLFVSTARCGHYLCATTTVAVDESIRSVAQNSGVTLSLGTVQSHVKMKCDADEIVWVRETSTVLLDYFLNCEHVVPRAIVYPVAKGVRAFEASYVNSPPDPTAKPAMRCIMSPLVPDGFAPVISKNNERAAIEGRVLQNRSNVPLSSYDRSYLTEFVNFVVPPEIRGSLHPVEPNDVAERQAEPRQKRTLFQGMWLVSWFRRFWEVFLKKEAYQKVTEPRIITIVDSGAKMTLSRYMYAMQRVLKACVWYAPGKTPTEIATRVAEICVGAKTIADDDANRMDGHISPAAREVDLAVDLAAFNITHHEEIRKFHAESQSLPVVSTFGLKYLGEFEWGSGDPRTSNSQTLRNAFIHYTSLRDSGHSPEEAYRRLGLYAGDDGFTADADPDKIIQSAMRIGQVYEVNIVKRGDLGVQFLGRRYGPDVWNGDWNSICDVPRALSKLHLATPGNYESEAKAVEKAFAYMLTDRNTPIIGQWAERVFNAFPHLHSFATLSKDVSWWVQNYADSELWPNNVGHWAWELVLGLMPGFDVKRFKLWVSETPRSLLLSAPLFQLPKEADKDGFVEHGDPRGLLSVPRIPNPLIAEPGEKLVAKATPAVAKAPKVDKPPAAKATKKGEAKQAPPKAGPKKAGKVSEKAKAAEASVVPAPPAAPGSI